MKVILLRDVAKIGKRFEVKEVPTGHALNFLIPRKFAEPATPENLRRVKDIHVKMAHTATVHSEQFTDALIKLAHSPLVISANANEQGHLFKGVHVEDIVTAASAQDIHLTAHEIVLPHAIKEVGVHEITIIHGDRKGVIHIEIVAG